MDLNKILNKQNATIIDVREPYEFESGYAKGAVNIPLGSLADNVMVIKGMTAPIVVYCRSGVRSAIATQLLISLGVQDVFDGGSYNNMVYFLKLAS